jgi:hypothetical protein
MLRVLLQFRHRRFRRDLSAYADNMLSQRARRRLEAHLDSCQACRQELTELRLTVEALGSLPMAEVPRSFALAAAPVAEVGPRPAARRLEFGLRLATATAAFALALVVIGDFAGLPGGGKEEMPAPLAPAADETRAFMYAEPVQTPAAVQAPPVETPAADETPPAVQAPPVETPAEAGVGTVQTPTAEETPPAVQPGPVGTPAAEETPAVMGVPPVETPAAEETPAALAAPPVTTPAVAVPGITETETGQAPTGAGVSEEQPPEEKATEGVGVEKEAQGYGAEAQAAEEEGGGLSREETVRWLEIGLGAGVGILVALWALARLRTSIGSQS